MSTWVRALAVLSSGMLGGGLASAGDVSDDTTSPDREALQMHWAAGDYADALPIAERIVEAKQRTVAAGQYELAAPLHNLATIQRNLQQYDASEQNFARSIDIAAETKGPYAPILLASMSQLGALHYQTQRYAESLELLRRAQHIAHRNHGVYTLKQLSIVDWITKVNLATGQILAATCNALS